MALTGKKKADFLKKMAAGKAKAKRRRTSSSKSSTKKRSTRTRNPSRSTAAKGEVIVPKDGSFIDRYGPMLAGVSLGAIGAPIAMKVAEDVFVDRGVPGVAAYGAGALGSLVLGIAASAAVKGSNKPMKVVKSALPWAGAVLAAPLLVQAYQDAMSRGRSQVTTLETAVLDDTAALPDGTVAGSVVPGRLATYGGMNGSIQPGLIPSAIASQSMSGSLAPGAIPSMRGVRAGFGFGGR